MTQLEMAVLVMDYLENLNVNGVNILEAICDKNIKKSYQLIKSNPTITKAEFLEQMEIDEYDFD